MIDVSQAPYNVVGDWNGSDTTATNNTAALQAAIADAQASNTLGGVVDNGGTQGDTILLPKGSIMFDDTLTLGDGVSFQGSGDFATNLRVKGNFASNKHRIRLGSPGDTLSSFGGRLSNLVVSQPKTLETNSDIALVYTNDVQDGTIMDHVLLRGFQTRCFVGEVGYGGATLIRMRQLGGNTRRAAGAVPAFSFDYGEGTMIDVEGFEPSGGRIDPTDPNSPSAPGSVGCYVRGGFGSFRHVHGELLETCMLLNLKSTKCFCDINFMTGGPENHYEIVVQNNAAQLNRIRLANIVRNGSPPTNPLVLNGQSGGSHIFNDIIDPIR